QVQRGPAGGAHVLMDVVLVTLGDPQRLTGGYLYHQRIAELAPRHGARITFASFPDMPFPLAAFTAGRVRRQAEQADAILLDSLAAAFLGPSLWLHPPGRPLLGILH